MDFKKKRQSELLFSSDVLQGLFQNGKSEFSDQFLRWKMAQKWSDIVGPFIAEQTEPISAVNGTLYVWVKNSVWLQQLYFLTNDLKVKVNIEAGTNWIRTIKFTTDRRSVPTDSKHK